MFGTPRPNKVHLRRERVGAVGRIPVTLLARPERRVDVTHLLVHPPAAGTRTVVDEPGPLTATETEVLAHNLPQQLAHTDAQGPGDLPQGL